MLATSLLSQQDPRFSFFYVANVKDGGNVVHGFRVSESNGSVAVLDSQQGFPVQTGRPGNAFSNDRLLCVDRTNDRLFVLNVNDSFTIASVSGYRINRSSGRLAELAWSPHAVNLSMLDSSMPGRTHALGACATHPSKSPDTLLTVAISKTGFAPRNGFVASYILSDDSISQAAGSPFATGGPNPNDVRFSPDGSYLYAGGSVSGRDIAIFEVNSSNGVLTPATGSPFDDQTLGPVRAYQVTAQGFVAVGGYANTSDGEEVLYYPSTSSGVPSFGASVTTGLSFGATSMLHPSGFYLVADRGFSSDQSRVGVYAFSSARGASVSAVPGSPFSTGGDSATNQGVGANLLARTDNGDFIYVAHAGTRNFTRFSIDTSSGVLTKGPTQDQNSIGSAGRPSGIGFVSQQVVCGDGTIDLGLDPVPIGGQEVCDDGNAVDGDGCSATCQEIEENFECPVPGEACVRIPNVDVSVTKTDHVTAATPGASLTYEVEVRNSGPDTDPDVRLTDSLPDALTCSFTSEASGTASGNTPSGAGDLDETLSLGPGASVIYTLACQIASSAIGTLINTADVTTSLQDNDPGNNSATDDDTLLVPSADLAVAKTVDADAKHPADAVSYEIVVSNLGPSDALNSTFSDSVPTEVEAVSWTCTASPGSSCGSGGAGHTIADSLHLLANGQATYQISGVIAGDFTGTAVNTATASNAVIDDPNPTNDSDTVAIGVTSPADVEASKRVAGDQVPGGEITYTIVLSNRSVHAQFDDPDSDEFSDRLPDQLILKGGSANGGSLLVDGNEVRWNGGVAGSSEITIVLDASIRVGAADELVVNQATVLTDLDGDGVNDTLRLSDDPDVSGAEDETQFVVAPIVAIPMLSPIGLLGLVLALVLAGRGPLSRM